MSPGKPEAPPATSEPPATPVAANGGGVVVPLRQAAVTAPAEPVAASTPVVPSAEPAPVSAPVQAPVTTPAATLGAGDWWAQLLERMQLDGLVGNLARHAMLISREGEAWQLRLDPGHQPMATDTRIKELAGAISDYLGKPVRLQVSFEAGGEDTPAQREERARREKLAHAKDTLRSDPVVQALVSEFDGRLDEDSIEPQ